MSDVPLVQLGQIVLTSGALHALGEADVFQALRRHRAGDWGEVDAHDSQANEEALRQGGRLLSSYRTAGGREFWVITEWDRSVTTVLLPEEY